MNTDIIGVISAAMAVLGFLSVWVKMGVEKGRQEKVTETLERKTHEQESGIAGITNTVRGIRAEVKGFAEKITGHEIGITELKNATHSIQVDIARSMGRIEAKLEHLQEAVVELKPKGGRNAPEK